AQASAALNAGSRQTARCDVAATGGDPVRSERGISGLRDGAHLRRYLVVRTRLERWQHSIFPGPCAGGRLTPCARTSRSLMLLPPGRANARAPVRRRECPLDIRATTAPIPSRGEGDGPWRTRRVGTS